MVMSYQAGAKLDVAEEEADAHDRREAGSEDGDGGGGGVESAEE